jgi:hypothetical protein
METENVPKPAISKEATTIGSCTVKIFNFSIIPISLSSSAIGGIVSYRIGSTAPLSTASIAVRCAFYIKKKKHFSLGLLEKIGLSPSMF